MIDQVLHHGEIEIERARLEHHANQAERVARGSCHIVSQDADLPSLGAVEARDQGKQRGLAGAVEAQENRESRRRNGEGHVGQRLARSVGIADALDGERHRWRGCDPVHHVGAILGAAITAVKS
jgi:hypothetical protein